MSNTVTWNDPDKVQKSQGQYSPGVMYLVDPVTQKVVSPGGGGGGGGAVTDITASGNLTTASGAGSTVSIALGTGQATWEAQLTGTFSAGTTIVFEGSDDNTNWFAVYGVNVSLANPTPISSIGGAGPFLIRGVSSGYQNFRVRCSVLHSGDNVAVVLIGSVGASGNGGLATNDGTFAKETGGNLASIATNTTGLGTQTTLASILTALQGILSTEIIDLSTTGTISAAQSTEGTPVSNATVVLTVGNGQSTWKAQLLAGGGGFTSGTTIVADKSVDGGTTWYSASFKVSGASPATPVSSVVGPGPIEMTGDASGANRVRIRCSVLNSTETVAVTLRASTGVSDVGLISSIPAGSNVIGGVTAASGAFADGAITTLGTEADAAWGLSGNATAIAVLKELALLLQHVAYDNTNEIKASLYGKNSAAGDTPIGVDASGRLTAAIQAVLGTALAADQSNTVLRISNYVKTATAGDTALALGQATFANSLSVVQASDSPARTWTRIYNTTQTGVSSWTGSGSLTSLDQYTYLVANINVSAISGTSIQFKINRIDGFANVNTLANGSTISGANTTDKFSVGPGCSQNHPFGQTASITAAFTAITSVTFTVEVWAR
jgi:hypothetical protein